MSSNSKICLLAMDALESTSVFTNIRSQEASLNIREGLWLRGRITI